MYRDRKGFAENEHTINLPRWSVTMRQTNHEKNSLQHSAKLSRNHHWQITAIRFCLYLIVLPAYIIPFIPLLLQLTTSGIRWLTIRDSVPFILFGLISLMVVQMLAIPFWQSVKAVIYYELSN